MLNGIKDNTQELLDRGYSPEAIKAAKAQEPESSVTVMNLMFKRSVKDFKYPLMMYVLALFENYERGNLPFPGAVAEQPAQIMEIFSLLQAIKTDFQSKNAPRMPKT